MRTIRMPLRRTGSPDVGAAGARSAAWMVQVFLAIGAVYGVLFLLDAHRRTLKSALELAPEEIAVVTASHDLAMGEEITAGDLELRANRSAYVPANALTTPELVVGRIAKERILRGELIRTERLADIGNGTGITAILATGMRAQSLDLQGAELVSGFIAPGDRVDVVTTLLDLENFEPPVTQTLLQNVKVLAIAEQIDPDRTPSQQHMERVTLSVAPSDAERLTEAMRTGRIRLVLRSALDIDWVAGGETTTSDLLTDGRHPGPTSPR